MEALEVMCGQIHKKTNVYSFYFVLSVYCIFSLGYFFTYRWVKHQFYLMLCKRENQAVNCSDFFIFVYFYTKAQHIKKYIANEFSP